MMRGINTTVRRLRRKVFEEVAALGFKAEADTLCDDMEAIPYALVNDETEQYRDSVYRARAVVREQVRLAMGLSLRPEDKPVHLTAGVEASNISDKYYEPPLMQVIPSACMRCEAKGYEVSNMCKGCLAHPCMEVCPKGAISMVNGKSHIDQEKCIKCGKCKSVCPYDAISKKERPCAKACGVNAIESDKMGRAYVNPDKCVSCGMCMVSCPFGAISDKSQIFQLARALSEGEQIIAEIAPAFTGQFGDNINARNLKAALEELGFSQVYDVAVDLRADSPTFGKWFGVLLTEENKKQFFIPKNFAHGFLVLSDYAEFAYKCTDFYHPNDEGGLAWNDPDIGVEWPIPEGMELIQSEKDTKWGGIKEYKAE